VRLEELKNTNDHIMKVEKVPKEWTKGLFCKRKATLRNAVTGEGD